MKPFDIEIPERDGALHGTAYRILSVASELFAAQGFPATTVKEITSGCGITQAALYLYFPSKEAVLVELITIAHAQLARNLDEEVSQHSDQNEPAQVLADLVKGFVTFGTEYTVLARIADRETRALPELEYSKVTDLRRDVRRRFETAISAGFKQGVFTVLPRIEHPEIFLATAIIDMCAGTFSWFDSGVKVPSDVLIFGYQEAALALVGARPRTLIH